MKKPSAVLLLCLALIGVTFSLSAQSAFLPTGDNGAGIEARALLSLSGFEGFGATLGYSIGGILDLGADVAITFYDDNGYAAADVKVAALYNIHVLKQDDTVPISALLKGSYGLIVVNSDYLVSVHELKRASGFSIGFDLYRDFHIGPVFLLRLGATAGYVSYLYTTTNELPVPASYPVEERDADISYGALFALLWRLGSGSTISLGGSATVNGALQWSFTPALSLTVPTRSSRR
jgi:hypothetical protein